MWEGAPSGTFPDRDAMFSRLLTFCLLGLAACAGSAPVRTGSASEERMRAWTSELEQLTVEARVEGPAATCQRAPRVCAIATDVCGVAAAEPSRQVFQEHCRRAQEHCAGFRQSCHRDASPRARLTQTPRFP